jgi:hypothetical protein
MRSMRRPAEIAEVASFRRPSLKVPESRDGGMLSCMAKQVTKPIRNREAWSPSRS